MNLSNRKPIAIWDKKQADLFHLSPEAVKNAWDAYAQREADDFNNEAFGLDRNSSTIHEWTPPLKFETWYENTYGKSISAPVTPVMVANLATKLVALQQELAQAGLLKSYRKMGEVVQELGYEAAEVIEQHVA